jgi:hypothetical protein
MPGGGGDHLTFSTRSGTRQGVIEHTFRVELQRDLVTWTTELVQGVNNSVLAIKELSTGALCYSYLTIFILNLIFIF